MSKVGSTLGFMLHLALIGFGIWVSIQLVTLKAGLTERGIGIVIGDICLVYLLAHIMAWIYDIHTKKGD